MEFLKNYFNELGISKWSDLAEEGAVKMQCQKRTDKIVKLIIPKMDMELSVENLHQLKKEFLFRYLQEAPNGRRWRERTVLNALARAKNIQYDFMIEYENISFVYEVDLDSWCEIIAIISILSQPSLQEYGYKWDEDTIEAVRHLKSVLKKTYQ